MINYEATQDVYYGSSDGGFGDFAYKEGHVEIETFTGVIGGLFCLNFISFAKPKKITLVDCNKHAIEMSKVVIDQILKAGGREDFFELLNDGKYSCNPILHDDLQKLGNATIQDTWSSTKFTGRKRKPIKESWGYALENFKDLQKTLQTAHIEYKLADITTLDIDSDWIWYSNVYKKEVVENSRAFHSYIYHDIQEIREKDSIREIKINDYPKLKEQASKEGVIFYSEDKMTHFGYFRDNKLISFLGFLPLSKTKAYFKNSFTLPEYRRQGVGTYLDNYRLKELKRRGFKEWSASVTKASLNMQLRAGAEIVEGSKIRGDL